jgi:hypothetical protein
MTDNGYFYSKFSDFELFPPEMCLHNNGDLWHNLNQKLIDCISDIHRLLDRIYPGSCMIANNWHKDGPYKYRGFRPFNCGVGMPHGAHYKGLAIDFDVLMISKLIPAEDIRSRILENRQTIRHLAGIEYGVNWTHIDCMQEEDSQSRFGIRDGKIILFDKTNQSRTV